MTRHPVRPGSGDVAGQSANDPPPALPRRLQTMMQAGRRSEGDRASGALLRTERSGDGTAGEGASMGLEWG